MFRECLQKDLMTVWFAISMKPTFELTLTMGKLWDPDNLDDFDGERPANYDADLWHELSDVEDNGEFEEDAHTSSEEESVDLVSQEEILALEAFDDHECYIIE
ncbi:hypothetical protein P9112_006539 [Eukaryota sp. TZLM1-RC]